jgi:ribosome-binding factor A
MTTRRTAKAARLIREAVSSGIILELKDPRVHDVTVIDVEVAEDMRSAKVFVSIRGTPKQQALVMKGLDSSRGFLQSKVADRIETRYIPILSFVLTDLVQKNAELEEAFRKIREEEAAVAGTTLPATDDETKIATSEDDQFDDENEDDSEE